MIKGISFKVNNQELFGTLHKATEEKACILIIAGGGSIPRNDGYYPSWQKYFANRGITTFNFDFRGVGESTGKLKETNLETRVDDAKAAFEILRRESGTNNIYVMGTSMGAPVAIQVIDSSVEGILLIVPAAYSSEARCKNFGPDFSEAIRKPSSWKHSPEFKELEHYSGKLFLLYGTEDQVVPQEIFLSYEKIVRLKNGVITRLEGENHKSWVTTQTDSVLKSMTQFILT